MSQKVVGPYKAKKDQPKISSSHSWSRSRLSLDRSISLSISRSIGLSIHLQIEGCYQKNIFYYPGLALYKIAGAAPPGARRPTLTPGPLAGSGVHTPFRSIYIYLPRQSTDQLIFFLQVLPEKKNLSHRNLSQKIPRKKNSAKPCRQTMISSRGKKKVKCLRRCLTSQHKGS